MRALRKTEENSLTKERVSKIAPSRVREIAPLNAAVFGGHVTLETFGRPHIAAIIDGRLSDGSFRFLCLLSAVTFKGELELSYPELAAAMGVNVRMAKYRIAELRRLGMVEVTGRLHHRNCYRVVAGAAISAPSTRVDTESTIVGCPNCTRDLKLTKRGICVACSREANKVDAWVAAKEQLGPGATDIDIAARVVANKAVKSHRQAAKAADRLEKYEAEWTA